MYEDFSEHRDLKLGGVVARVVGGICIALGLFWMVKCAIAYFDSVGRTYPDIPSGPRPQDVEAALMDLAFRGGVIFLIGLGLYLLGAIALVVRKAELKRQDDQFHRAKGESGGLAE